MKYRYTLFFFLPFLLFQVKGHSQNNSCEFTFELRDGFGDGWNGAALFVKLNETEFVFDLDNETDNGFLESIPLTITSGDQLTIRYSSGLYDEEVSWALIDPQGDVVLEFNGNPTEGVVFDQAVECPPCIGPRTEQVFVVDVRAATADLSWIDVNEGAGLYAVEAGLRGFTPGTGTTVQTAASEIRLRGLMQNTSYDVYITLLCENGESSKVAGPVTFKTRFATDVRIREILNPMTSCDLSFNDTVRVAIENVGGEPQSLIPFKYEVNGVEVPINLPNDGLYTGVLSKDSIGLTEFDQTFNFGNPGEYRIRSWTDLAEDSFRSNDTTEINIVSIPDIFEYPYFENFEVWGGGWTVAEESNAPSWARGIPAGNEISMAAGGIGAWVTNLSGRYNFGELSYLVSPCLNLSSFTDDPVISFSLFVDTEEEFDGAWLEFSADDGETWNKVGQAATGLNWYNNPVAQRWEGDGGFDGWAFVSNTLTGTAGLERVRLRFVFFSDISTEREGIGIDNVLISLPFNQDLAAVSVTATSEEACGVLSDSIELTISNLGMDAITQFEMNYRIGDTGEVITESLSQTLSSGDQLVYRFETPFNSFEQETLNITAWVSLPGGDQFAGNDTVRMSLSTLQSFPYAENFEIQRIPDRWQTDGVVTNGHGNRSFVLSDNLSASNTTFSALSPLLGPVAAQDSLRFDYRFVSLQGDGSVPYSLSEGEELLIQISTDCGQTFETLLTIDQSSHDPTILMTSRTILLEAFEGETVQFRFLANRIGGAFWVDLDNINVVRCPPSLLLSLTGVNEMGEDGRNGSASVEAGAGVGPFSYQWSSGDITKTASKLTAGTYTVTVTDQFGCKDEGQVLVGLTTDVEEPGDEVLLRFFPNPTRDVTIMDLQLGQPRNVRIQLLNLMGQMIWEDQEQGVESLRYLIDLTAFPDGIYMIRLLAGDRQVVRRLIKSR